MDGWTLPGDANSLAAEFELFACGKLFNDECHHYFIDLERTRDTIAWVTFRIDVGWPPPHLSPFAYVSLRTLSLSQMTKITLHWPEPDWPAMCEPCYSKEEIVEIIRTFVIQMVNRQPPGWKIDRKQTIMRLFAEGATNEELALATNTSVPTVKRELIELGLRRNKR